MYNDLSDKKGNETIENFNHNDYEAGKPDWSNGDWKWNLINALREHHFLK